jgi:hypothetical protein
MFLLAGCDEKSGKYGCQPIGWKAQLPSRYQQNRGNFHPFSLKCFISVHVCFKSKDWRKKKTAATRF